MTVPAKPVILLDRDGTINVDRDYLSDPAQLEFEAGAIDGLKAFMGMGATLVVVTNQSGVARGFFDLAAANAVNRRLDSMLRVEGIIVAGYYICPHGPDEGCTCRKPLAGLSLQAAADHGFDPSTALVIGDKLSDLGLAETIGAKGVLVKTGKGASLAEKAQKMGYVVAENLRDVALMMANSIDCGDSDPFSAFDRRTIRTRDRASQ